jgi:hypothetical protein
MYAIAIALITNTATMMYSQIGRRGNRLSLAVMNNRRMLVPLALAQAYQTRSLPLLRQ